MFFCKYQIYSAKCGCTEFVLRCFQSRFMLKPQLSCLVRLFSPGEQDLFYHDTLLNSMLFFKLSLYRSVLVHSAKLYALKKQIARFCVPFFGISWIIFAKWFGLFGFLRMILLFIPPLLSNQLQPFFYLHFCGK